MLVERKQIYWRERRRNKKFGTLVGKFEEKSIYKIVYRYIYI